MQDQLARLAAFALATVVVGSTSMAAPVHRHPAAARVVVMYTGEVNVNTAAKFTTTVSNNLDKVIGLKVYVDPGNDADLEKNAYLVGYDNNQFSVWKGKPGESGGGIEVVRNGLIDRTMGFYVIDGFYIVKSGGLHQGTLSYGLQPVDEGVVRLNPAVKVVQRPF
jgi:hypothetical protein